MVRVTEFDPSAFLDDDEVVAEYLTAALEDENPDVFLAAVGNVAKARGMSVIAERAGLGRESLYKALASGAEPELRHYPEGTSESWRQALRVCGITIRSTRTHLGRHASCLRKSRAGLRRAGELRR